MRLPAKTIPFQQQNPDENVLPAQRDSFPPTSHAFSVHLPQPTARLPYKLLDEYSYPPFKAINELIAWCGIKVGFHISSTNLGRLLSTLLYSRSFAFFM